MPGFEDFNARVRPTPAGFALPHAPRDERRFPTATGKANFTAAPVEYPQVPEGRLLLQTLRSHDQYNTTIYGLDDRYRGIKNGRRVVLVNPEDAGALGLADGAYADLVSEWTDGVRAARAAASASCTTPPPAAAPPPTSPRPTSWCRSTPPPTPATPRPASPS